MGDNVGAFIMGTEIRVYFDIYFTTVFSYYLGLLAPTYLGTFLIEEIICGLKESNDFFEKAANVFNDEIGHNLTKLGLELLKMYGEKIKENKDSNFHMNNVEKFVKQAKHEKRDVLEKYKECKELYGKDENIIHKFMNIINDREDELYYFAEEHINKFAKYLIEEKRLKEKTALLYCRNIELFICDFLCYESEEELKKIDNMMVDRYLGEWFISTCATSVSSIKAQIYALSHYFNFLYDEGFISNLQNNKIKELWGNPLLRYSNILSGLFHGKVVVCDSDYDCLFYQAIMNAIYEQKNEISPDILFTHCGGKSRIKDVVSALKAVNVPVVAISDFDLLNSSQNFRPLANAFGINWETELLPNMKIIYDGMNAKNSSGDDAWTQIKKIGKSGFDGNAPAAYEKVEEVCKTAGLFIVPVGEMECFDKTINKEKKEWVYHVLENYGLASESRLEGARQFVQLVCDFKPQNNVETV